jgi:hypothetical protein
LGFDGVVDISMVCIGCFDIMLSERGYCVVENQIWKFYVEDGFQWVFVETSHRTR